MGWQPIETAPRDGLPVLLFYPDRPGPWRVKLGFWRNTDNWFGYYGATSKRDERRQPTHWMPVPAAPETASAAAPVGMERSAQPGAECTKQVSPDAS